MNKVSALVIVALGVACTAQSQATPILRLTAFSGSTADSSILASAIVSDGNVALSPAVVGSSSIDTDWGASAGSVVFSSALGGWSLNVSTGLSKPILGYDLHPSLDLNSVNVSSVGAGLLRIEFTDTDFRWSGEAPFSASIGGVASGTISYKTFIDASNAAFGKATLLNDVGTFTAGAFSSTTSTYMASPALYSLTAVVDILHPGASMATSFNATLEVPEPSSIALLGFGLLAVGWVARRSRRAQ